MSFLSYAEAVEHVDNSQVAPSSRCALRKLAEGLQVILKYEDRFNYCFEHDIAFFSYPDCGMSAEDIDAMVSYGFHLQDDSWISFAR